MLYISWLTTSPLSTKTLRDSSTQILLSLMSLCSWSLSPLTAMPHTAFAQTVRGHHFMQIKTVKQALILNSLYVVLTPSSTQHEWPAVTIQISQAASLLIPTAVHSQSYWASVSRKKHFPVQPDSSFLEILYKPQTNIAGVSIGVLLVKLIYDSL